LPDSVFPNNWFSTHGGANIPGGVFFTYPMRVPSRQREINPLIVKEIGSQYWHVEHIRAAKKGSALEGTGSLIFDERLNKVYCSLSERACPDTLNDYMNTLNKLAQKPYKLITFNATDREGGSIYHTNVMLAMLDRHAVCCLDSVVDPKESSELVKELAEGGRQVILLSHDEMGEMCGNMIQVKNAEDKLCVIMSDRAKKGLRKENLALLEKNYQIISSDISVIETIGGGSARCMVAELF